MSCQLGLLWLTGACNEGVLNPQVPATAAWLNSAETPVIAAPGDTLPGSFRIVVKDPAGAPVRGIHVTWQATGTNAKAIPATLTTDADGQAAARWQVGTVATDVQSLSAIVATRDGALSATAFAIVQPTQAARLEIPDTVSVRLGDAEQLHVAAVDVYGNRFSPALASLTVGDPRVAGVRSDSVVGVKRGFTRAIVTAAGATDSVVVNVRQVVARLVATTDTVRLDALGDTANVSVSVLDDRAREVADTAIVVDSLLTPVRARLSSPTSVELVGQATGAALITLRVGAVSTTVNAVVAQVPTRITMATDSATSDALGDSVSMSSTVFDRLGNHIPGAPVVWRSTNAQVATVDSAGVVRTVGDGVALVIARVTGVGADSALIRVRQRATTIAFSPVSVDIGAFGPVQLPRALAADRNGQPMQRRPALSTSNAGVLDVDSTEAAVAHTNGQAIVIAAIDGVADTLSVNVRQRAAKIIPAVDSILLVSLASSQPIPVVVVDANGNVVDRPALEVSVEDSTTARVIGRDVQAVANGRTIARLSLDGAVATLAVRVQQRAVRIDVQGDQAVLMVAAAGSALPLVCTAYDGTDHPLTGSIAVRSKEGRVTGTECSSLAAAASGRDTLVLSAPGFSGDHPVVVALKAIIEQSVGDAVVFDSMPSGTGPWAPTARVRSTGEIELYVTGYQVADHRGDLHRYVSTDGMHFTYDGVALQRDADPCALRGSGLENIAVVPRSDGPGWRMFFAGGSFPCYGWQVFSAVSTDERSWTIEPGIRLSNGGTVPPAAPSTPPWPTGEGMDIDRLPNGEWRMIVSAYERVLPATDVWQITEWRSADQLAWRYVGVVLNTRDVPQEARASIYSPTIREIAPGLWRMIFTGDNRFDAGARSRLWTALSLDRSTWQFEGELVGAVGSSFLYSSLAGDRLYFLRRDGSGLNYVAQTRILMP